MKKSIGQNITYYRKKCGFTQEELSVKMNVTVQAVSKWENDLSYPDLECVSTLASVLNTTVNKLINGEDDISEISVSENVDIKKKIFMITMGSNEDSGDKIKLRLPLQLIADVKDSPILKTLLKDRKTEIDTILSAVKLGGVGPICELESGDDYIRIEIIDKN